MAEPARRAATYADLEAVPPHLVAEILFGNLVTHPRPSPRHGAASSALGVELGGPFQKGSGGPGGWIFIDEPELHLGPHVTVPDLAGWRRERLTDLPDIAWIEIAPDWICELLSPSTEKYDRGVKRLIYAQAGVPHLWHVDPRPQILEVFELVNGKWLLHEAFQGSAKVSAPPFEALTFDLSLLWPFDPPAEKPG